MSECMRVLLHVRISGFKAMIEEKVNKKWIANGNINLLGRDEKFLELARKAGCIAWFVGIESISPASLKEAHKISNKVNEYEKAIKTIRKHGMAVVSGIIFGFDGDTPEIFDTTLESMLGWEIDAGEFNVLTPYPGTPLYDRLDKKRRLLPEEHDARGADGGDTACHKGLLLHAPDDKTSLRKCQTVEIRPHIVCRALDKLCDEALLPEGVFLMAGRCPGKPI